MLEIGQKIKVVVEGPHGRGVVNATIQRFAIDEYHHRTLFDANSGRRDLHYSYDLVEEGVTWCLDEPEAAGALEAAVALGAPSCWETVIDDAALGAVRITGSAGAKFTLTPNATSR